jgi:MFS family permease
MDPAQPRLITDVIEEIGFGVAQIRITLLTSLSVSALIGAELMYVSTLSASVLRATGALERYRYALSASSSMGMLVGCVLSGFFGDRGRKRAVQISLTIMAGAGFLSVLFTDFYWVVVLRAFVGMGLMIGSGPSLCMVSETVPVRMRIPLQVLRSTAHGLGGLAVAVVEVFDDSYLLDLHWRTYTIMLASFCACMCLCVTFMLPDSPVFLESIGEVEAAEQGLRWLRDVNGSEAEVAFSPTARSPVLVPTKRVRLLFSMEYFRVTVTAFWACFTMNLLLSGTLYAVEEMQETEGREKPVWSMLQSSGIGVALCLICGPVLPLFSKINVMIASLTVGALSSFAWTVCGSLPWARGTMLCGTISSNLAYVQVAVGFVVVFQFAVDMYPTQVACTSSALVNAAGRVASFLAPALFDSIYRSVGWQYFYVLMIVFCVISIAILASSSDLKPFSPKVSRKNYGALA